MVQRLIIQKMLTRAITGFFFIAVLIGAILLGQYSFVVFFSLLGTWCLFEFYGMVKSVVVRPHIIVGLVTAAVLGSLVSLYCLGIIPLNMVWLFLPLFSAVFIVSLFQKHAQPFHDIAYTFLGVIYASFPFLFFLSLGFIKGEYNPYIPLGFMLILWSNDTGAYLAGRSFGKRKLFERISPNKTWEGFIGGIVLAFFVALNLAQYFGSLQKWEWATMAIIIGVFGTLGDLVESMLKRSLGVKDSGKILPGHGGLLDRFDGLLIAAPLVFIFLLLIQ